MLHAIQSIYTTNLGIRRDERVLVFTDRISSRESVDERDCCRRDRLRDISLLTAEVGKSFAKKLSYLEYEAPGSHGVEPPRDLWEAAFGKRAVKALDDEGLLSPLLKKEIGSDDLSRVEAIIKRQSRSSVDAVIALSNYSTSHTRFRDLLTRICGCRYASMPLFDASMIEGPMSVDWKTPRKRTVAVAKVVDKAVKVEIKTPNGTDLTLSKQGRKALPDTGILTKEGSFGNLPAGEVYLAPCEGTAQGKLVLDWAPTRALASPVTLTIRDGSVEEVAGDEPYAVTLRKKIGERQENRNIAELGIGTNDRALRPDNILESEKILGTIHIALGDNSSFGGTVKTPFHQDFIFFRPTVTLIMKDGTKTVLLKNGSMVI
ncbi:MAG: aminopeptidase [Thermodesulfovibrionales bacterium]|jgi:leucyl aminopeptidase (aminopeptidase T)